MELNEIQPRLNDGLCAIADIIHYSSLSLRPFFIGSMEVFFLYVKWFFPKASNGESFSSTNTKSPYNLSCILRWEIFLITDDFKYLLVFFLCPYFLIFLFLIRHISKNLFRLFSNLNHSQWIFESNFKHFSGIICFSFDNINMYLLHAGFAHRRLMWISSYLYSLYWTFMSFIVSEIREI